MNRCKAIDMLRAAAVFLVLGRHMIPCPASDSAWLSTLTALWYRAGWIGVDLFFVLSGFLVSSLLFTEYRTHGKLDVMRFLIRRGWKIYPGFWVLILVTVAVALAQGYQIPSGRLIAELGFVQNYFLGLWNHTWSLAVEEHFYIALAMLMWGLSRRPMQCQPFSILPVLCAVVAGTCLILRVVMASSISFSYYTHFFPSHLRIDSLMFGLLISYEYHFNNLRFTSWSTKWRHLILPSGLSLLMLALVFPLESSQFIRVSGVSFIYLGSGLVLIGCLGTRSGSGPIGDALAFIGSRSYSIYLWHMPVAVWGCALAARLLGIYWNWYWYALIYLLGSILVGITAAALVELPALCIRDRFFPSRSGTLATHSNDATVVGKPDRSRDYVELVPELERLRGLGPVR
jgi:peptidoglycan/LPS O-acetylase OafA/YrhL